MLRPLPSFKAAQPTAVARHLLKIMLKANNLVPVTYGLSGALCGCAGGSGKPAQVARSPHLTRLHQLRGLGDAKVLKSLGRSPKGRHYRG